MTRLTIGASLLFVKVMAHTTLIQEQEGTMLGSLVPSISGLVLVAASLLLALTVREILPINGPAQIE